MKIKLDSLELDNIPAHIAIIMDGNGRWAKSKKLPAKAGHKAGAETLRKITEEADKIGVRYLSAYAFSTENWKRSPQEVADIMDLLREYLNQYMKDAKKNNIKMTIIGDKSRLAADIQQSIGELEQVTKNKTGLMMLIALNYGGRDDIKRAFQKGVDMALAGTLDAQSITEETLHALMDIYPAPDPELLIRTSGEYRISNFLLWNTAYTEFHFTDVLWPSFTKEDLYQAIYAYQNRQRRYGGR